MADNRTHYQKYKKSIDAAVKRWNAKNPNYWKKQYQKNKERYKGYQRERSAKRAAYVNRVKTMFGCSVCGYKKNSAALEFHHTDSDSKDITVAALRTSSMKRIKNEIRKCIILCANCHREAHNPDKQRSSSSPQS